MRLLFVGLLLSASGIAQGVLEGIVKGPDGQPITDAPVQARQRETKTPFRLYSGAAGRYRFANLPAGAYDVSIKYPGFAFEPFQKEGVEIAAGQATSLDVTLKSNNFGTLGDDAQTYLASFREKVKSRGGPVPRMPDGHPDLNGLWSGSDDPFPEDQDLLPWAAQIAEARIKNAFADSPSGLCLPADLTMSGPFFRKLIHTPKLLVMLNEDDVIGFRQIYLDGRPHPQDLNPTWNGHSVGHWEGDTLVVERVGLNTQSWLGAAPHTEQLKMTERFHRTDLGRLEVDIVAEDPGTLKSPWTLHEVWTLLPDTEDVNEYVCTENNRFVEHLVKK